MAGDRAAGRQPEAARGGSVGDEQFTPEYWGELVACLEVDTGRSRAEVLQFDPDHIDDLFATWKKCPPVRWTARAVAVGLGVIKAPVADPLDLPDGSFEKASARNADWFADPARFFQKK